MLVHDAIIEPKMVTGRFACTAVGRSAGDMQCSFRFKVIQIYNCVTINRLSITMFIPTRTQHLDLMFKIRTCGFLI